MTGQRFRARAGAVVAALVLSLAAWGAPALRAAAAEVPGRRPGALRGGGESQIDESAPDESAPVPGRAQGSGTLPERLREYVEGSLGRYDALKNKAPGFRRQGWFPSLYLRDPVHDVVVEPGADGVLAVTAHLSTARRDLEQRLVIAPADRFELPGADKRFCAELIGALAAAAPEVGHARLQFWFADLQAGGQMIWELRGGIGLSAAAARGVPAGARTAEAIWPLLDENTLPPSLWDGR